MQPKEVLMFSHRLRNSSYVISQNLRNRYHIDGIFDPKSLKPGHRREVKRLIANKRLIDHASNVLDTLFMRLRPNNDSLSD